MSKGPQNEGSVYQRASDGLWCAAVTLPSGKRKVVYGATEKEAIRKRRDLLAELDAGKPVQPGRVPTLAQYLDRWIRVRIAGEVTAGHLEASTADSYGEHARRYLAPAPIGRVKLPQLTADDVRGWQRDMLATVSERTGKCLSPRTVGMAHATLRRALNDAMRDEVLARNVAALVKPPAGQTQPVEAPTPDELGRVFAAMVEDKRSALWLTMLALGLRKGEALGMRWSRLDLDAGTVTLRRQIVRQRTAESVGGRRRGELVEKDLKTRESQAALGLPASLAAVLREHRSAQLRVRLAALVWVDSDLVFCTGIGTPIEPRAVNRWWAAVCERAGVRSLRVHDLRHAAASLAFAEGASIKEVQAMLRHARQSTTADIYVNVYEEVRRGTADRMDKVLRRLGSAS